MSKNEGGNEEERDNATNPYQAPAPNGLDDSTDDASVNDDPAASKSSGNSALFFFAAGICGMLYGSIFVRIYGFPDRQLPLAPIGLAIGIAVLFFSFVFIWFGIAIILAKFPRT